MSSINDKEVVKLWEVLNACHNSVHVSTLTSGFWGNKVTWYEDKHGIFSSAKTSNFFLTKTHVIP
jgi:hypothetical protein